MFFFSKCFVCIERITRLGERRRNGRAANNVAWLYPAPDCLNGNCATCSPNCGVATDATYASPPILFPFLFHERPRSFEFPALLWEFLSKDKNFISPCLRIAVKAYEHFSSRTTYPTIYNTNRYLNYLNFLPSMRLKIFQQFLRIHTFIDRSTKKSLHNVTFPRAKRERSRHAVKRK